MKIELTVEEVIAFLKTVYDDISIGNTPIMSYPVCEHDSREGVNTLSNEEVANNIRKMCSQNHLTLYINMILTYSTPRPDYDDIVGFLEMYDNEIVSMKEICGTWYVNTL